MAAFATSRALRAGSLAAALTLAACGRNPAPRQVVPNSNLITAEQIAAWGSRDAWEVLRRSGKVQMREHANEPVRMVSDRGRVSIMLDDSPMVLLDGVRVGDVELLRYVRAATIAQIRFLNSVQGTVSYGTGAVSGVIEIDTKEGDSGRV
jgi:outer membrane cobalamin receptor